MNYQILIVLQSTSEHGQKMSAMHSLSYENHASAEVAYEILLKNKAIAANGMHEKTIVLKLW